MADKRVLITGGARRLGAEFCRAFAAAGWHVICHYHHSHDDASALQASLRALGASVDLVQADLGDEGQRADMMRTVSARHGHIHALINNASLFEPDTGLQWQPNLARRQLEVNLLAPLALATWVARQPATPHATPACVIHVLDQKVLNLNPDYFSYTVSKLALERAVALQAQALAPDVRVCGIAPGLLYESGPQSTENLRVANRVNLLRRPTAPRDVARTALFFAETPSITGVTLAVDNGQHLVPLERDVMFVVDELIKSTATP